MSAERVKPLDEERLDVLIERGLALMTRRQRWTLRAKWAVRYFTGDIARRVPGYRAVSLACWRMKRQGVGGLWEPIYSPREKDFDRADKRLPWHGWGVIYASEGYRAYTPTSRTAEVWPEPRFARRALEDRYRAGYRSTLATWEPIKAAGDRS